MTADDAPSPDDLTPRQAEFCRQYLLDLNAHAAALRAGYSRATARGEIYRLMDRPAVGAEVRRLMAERARRTGVTAGRVVLELATVAFSTITDYEFADDGDIRLADGVDPLAHRAIASIKRRARKAGEDEEVETELRLWDKVVALRLLGRHLGLFDRTVSVAGDPERPVRVDVRHDHGPPPADAAVLEFVHRLGLATPEAAVG